MNYWWGYYSISISVYKMWGVRTKVKFSKRNYIYIYILDYSRDFILLKKRKKRLH